MAFGDRITNAARDIMLMAAQRRAAAQPNERLAAYNGFDERKPLVPAERKPLVPAEWREDPERKKYYDILNSWSEGYHYDGPPNGENYFGSLGPQYKRWYDGAYSRDGSMPGAVIRTPEALERTYRDGYEEWLDSINRRNRSW